MQAGDTETHNQAADSVQEDLRQRETPPRVTENKRAQVYETFYVSPPKPRYSASQAELQIGKGNKTLSFLFMSQSENKPRLKMKRFYSLDIELKK